MNTVLILFGVYFAALAVLLIMARPYQRRIQELAAELRVHAMSSDERRFVDSLVDSSYSWRSAVILALTFLVGIFQSATKLDSDCADFNHRFPVIANDPRVHELMEAHFATAVAVNPVVGILAILMRYTFRLKARLHRNNVEADRISDFLGLAATV